LVFVMEYCTIRRAGRQFFFRHPALTLHDDKIRFQILTAFSVFGAVSLGDHFLAFHRLIFPSSIGSSNPRRKELLLGCFTLSKGLRYPPKSREPPTRRHCVSPLNDLNPRDGDVCWTLNVNFYFLSGFLVHPFCSAPPA